MPMEEDHDCPAPSDPDADLDGFVPVADPFTITPPTLLENAEDIFEEERSPTKKRRAAVVNPSKWSGEEEKKLKDGLRKYLDRGERPSPEKIRKLVPKDIQAGRTFSSIKNKIFRMFKK